MPASKNLLIGLSVTFYYKEPISYDSWKPPISPYTSRVINDRHQSFLTGDLNFENSFKVVHRFGHVSDTKSLNKFRPIFLYTYLNYVIKHCGCFVQSNAIFLNFIINLHKNWIKNNRGFPVSKGSGNKGVSTVIRKWM